MRGVYLTGFMAAGKSLVGRRLAELLELPFVDLDLRVEDSASLTVSQIFAAEGESRFRALEADALRTTGRVAEVVALGGGALQAAENREWIRLHGCSVWLATPWRVLLRRLLEGESERSRPLLTADPEKLQALYRRRLVFYEKADFVVGAGTLDPSALAGAVAARVAAAR